MSYIDEVNYLPNWPIFFSCFASYTDKQPPPQQISIPTLQVRMLLSFPLLKYLYIGAEILQLHWLFLQETIEFNSTSPPSVIYSVLDFHKRPSAVLEMNPNDTEYAAVSYLSEKRMMHSWI